MEEEKHDVPFVSVSDTVTASSETGDRESPCEQNSDDADSPVIYETSTPTPVLDIHPEFRPRKPFEHTVRTRSSNRLRSRNRSVCFTEDSQVIPVETLHTSPKRTSKYPSAKNRRAPDEVFVLTPEQEEAVREKLCAVVRDHRCTYGDLYRFVFQAEGRHDNQIAYAEDLGNWICTRKWRDVHTNEKLGMKLLMNRRWLLPIIQSMWGVFEGRAFADQPLAPRNNRKRSVASLDVKFDRRSDPTMAIRETRRLLRRRYSEAGVPPIPPAEHQAGELPVYVEARRNLGKRKRRATVSNGALEQALAGFASKDSARRSLFSSGISEDATHDSLHTDAGGPSSGHKAVAASTPRRSPSAQVSTMSSSEPKELSPERLAASVTKADDATPPSPSHHYSHMSNASRPLSPPPVRRRKVPPPGEQCPQQRKEGRVSPLARGSRMYAALEEDHLARMMIPLVLEDNVCSRSSSGSDGGGRDSPRVAIDVLADEMERSEGLEGLRGGRERGSKGAEAEAEARDDAGEDSALGDSLASSLTESTSHAACEYLVRKDSDRLWYSDSDPVRLAPTMSSRIDDDYGDSDDGFWL
eukprot:Rmarinus@m.28332